MVTITKHPNTDNVSLDGQPSRTTASVYGSGLLRPTASYLGWLRRTTPDYARLLPDYFELRRTTSGLLGRTQGFSIPAPRTSLGLGGNYLLDFLSPLCRFGLHLQLPD